jgi:pilus assembly protein CpaE
MRSVGVIDASSDFVKGVQGLVRDLGVGEVKHLRSLAEADGFLGQGNVAVIVIGPSIDTDEALLLGRRLSDSAAPTSVVLVAESIDADLLRSALRSGLHDVIGAADPSADFVQAVREALEVAEKRRALAEPSPPEVGKGKIVSVFSMKGGVGKTVLATNLGVALADAQVKAVLVDLDLQFGDCGIMLGLQPTQTIADSAAAFDRLDTEMLQGQLASHRSGLSVLLAPVQPEQAEKITPARVTRILELLQEMFDIIVLDTSATFDETTLMALDRSDQVYAVTMMDIASIKNTRIALQKLRQLGYSTEMVEIVLNRADSKVWLVPNEVEQAIGSPVSFRIPSDRLVPRAVNKGIPVVLDSPRSEVARVFRDIAHSTARALGREATDVAQ